MEELFISFAITILSYGAGPIVLAYVWKRPISKRGLVIFCAVYSVIIFSIFTAIRAFAGMSTSSATPAFIWGILFYWVSYRHLKNSGRLHSHNNALKIPRSPLPAENMDVDCSQPITPAEPQISSHIVNSLYSSGVEPSVCSATVQSATAITSFPEKSRSVKIKSIICAPLFWCFLFSVSISIALGVHTYSLSSSLNIASAEIDSLSAKNEQLNEELSVTAHQLEASNKIGNKYSVLYNQIYPEYKFWHDYAVIVTTTGSKYHTYSCPHVKDRPFYILNVENAISQGYTPCLDCNPPT